jgi:hypothetical protein
MSRRLTSWQAPGTGVGVGARVGNGVGVGVALGVVGQKVEVDVGQGLDVGQGVDVAVGHGVSPAVAPANAAPRSVSNVSTTIAANAAVSPAPKIFAPACI